MYIMYALLIVLIIVILIVIIIFLYKNNESFKPDYSDYNRIDRIKINNNITHTLNKKNELITNATNIEDDKFGYCIGATPSCKTGGPIKVGVYQNGITYRSICDDGSNMVCDNFVSNNFDTMYNTDISDNSYVWKSPNNTKLLFSKIYKGFTEPTSYINVGLDNNIINIYDKDSNVIDTVDKCSFVGPNKDICKKTSKIPFMLADNKTYISGNHIYGNIDVYDASVNTYDANKMNDDVGYNVEPTITGSFTSSYTQVTPEIDYGKSGMFPGLPCIADYLSSPGDNVCNGEIGLIKDNTLICPYYKPICNGYRCDSKFGKCVERS